MLVFMHSCNYSALFAIIIIIINLHATNASSVAGLTYVVAMRRAHVASESHSSSDASENAVHMRRHPSASMSDGPAAPWVCRAARRMTSRVRLENITLWAEQVAHL